MQTLWHLSGPSRCLAGRAAVWLYEKAAICGPSGSVKSIMTWCVSRLERHGSGRTTMEGLELTDDARSLQAVRGVHVSEGRPG